MEEHSIELSEGGQHLKSWGISTCARLPFLADAIIDVVTAPLYLIGTLFALVPVIFTWGGEDQLEFFMEFGAKFLEKINHLTVSLVGSVVSPWLAYQISDVNIAYYSLIFCGSMATHISNRTVLAIHLN